MDNYKFEHIAIPDNLTETIREGIARGEKIYRKRKRDRFLVKIGGCAAAVLLCFGIFATQPVMASKVPIIRDIFKWFEKDYSYQGNLDSVAEKLEEPDELAESEEKLYSQTIDGVTVSLSEVYCSGEAIYMSLLFTNEEEFPATFVSENDGQPVICIRTIEKYPFTDEGDPGFGFGYLEGAFLDSKTYAGIYRIDIQDITCGDEEKKQQLLSAENLDMSFTIEQIIGDKAVRDVPDFQGKTEAEIEAMSDEEWKAFMSEVYAGDWGVFPNVHENWWYDGPFEFEVQMPVDVENVNNVIVDEIGENGAGIYSVSKSGFEVVVEEKNTEERWAQGTFVVVLDAEGKLLPYGSSSYANTFAIDGRDVSKVYVYVCDFSEYLDELKQYRETDTFKEVLDQNALYSKVIEFETTTE